MITQENLSGIIKSLNQKEIKRLKNSNKEYCVIYLHLFNVGAYATIKLTDNFTRHQYVSNNGNCILETQEVIDILNN